MADDRYRNSEYPRGGNDRDFDYGRDRGSGRDYTYSSAHSYEAAGQSGSREDRGPRDDRNFRGGGTGYGRPQQQQQGSDRDRGNYGRQPQGYDYQDRGFVDRAGDEVRSWFGDEDAERRRDADQRYNERLGSHGASAHGRDHDYDSWRRGQIDALDRDYHEYRQENAKRFESEFGTWRSARQTQRNSLSTVTEHMDVVGSDGEHVGTVDKVRGDRVLLTKSDPDAGGRHHSFPSSWITTVDTRVTLSKTAEQAKSHWRDEERAGALFGDEDRTSGRNQDGTVNLNRSFSGTY